MTTGPLTDKLVAYLKDAHAMETKVLAQLRHLTDTTRDLEMRKLLENHYVMTQLHEKRLADRLAALGRAPSAAAEAGAALGAWAKGISEMFRNDLPCRNLRDAFVTEHLEIATYEILEALAQRAGDVHVVAVCRENKADEYAMAQQLATLWDREVDQALLEAGFDVDAQGARLGAYGRRADAAERGQTWTGTDTEADMGIGMHGDRAEPDTAYDPFEGRVPGHGAELERPTSEPTSEAAETPPERLVERPEERVAEKPPERPPARP